MIPALAAMLGLLVQAPGKPHPVRVWRADSTAYVTLRAPGHLLLLHVDAIGRVRVIFPEAPDDNTAVANDAPIAVALPPEAEGNPATFLAVRSRWPFDFAALRMGSGWNYQDAFLLQPTGGDPIAALLDIADRVTDGRPYDFGVVTYLRGGAVATRRTPVQPVVCLGCVRQGTAVAAAPAAVTTNSVDCSSASLTNSFCGVATGSLSITSAPPTQMVYQPAAAAPAPVYVPYFVPMSRGFRPRFEHSPAPAPVVQRSQGVAFPIAPRLIVPSSAQLRGRRP